MINDHLILGLEKLWQKPRSRGEFMFMFNIS